RRQHDRHTAFVQITEFATDQHQLRRQMLPREQIGYLLAAQRRIPRATGLQLQAAQLIGLVSRDAAQQVVLITAAQYQHLDAALGSLIAQLQRQLQRTLVKGTENATGLPCFADQPVLQTDLMQRIAAVL